MTQVCLEPPQRYNTPESLYFPPKPVWFDAMVKYGISPMHLKTRAMEGLCNASRAKKVITEQKRRKIKYDRVFRKQRIKDMKRKDQQDFIENIGGLRLDFPDKKVQYLISLASLYGCYVV